MKKKQLFKIVPLIFLTLGLASCLKDELYTADTNESPNIVEFSEVPDEYANSSHIYSQFNEAFNVVALDTFTAVVSYSGKDVAPQDIVIDLKVDQLALEKYNDKIIADAEKADIDPVGLYDQIPSNLYTILNPQVTIKKGEKSATVSIVVKPALFDFTYRYGLPLSISSSMGVVSGTTSTAIFYIAAKNQYDGMYGLEGRLSGVTDRPTLNTSSPFTWPTDDGAGTIALITASINAIDIYDTYHNWGGGPAQWITPIGTAANGFSAFGSVRPRITIDNSTYKVTAVTNMFVNPANGRALALDPNYDSKYDPDAKELDVQFIMTQPGFQPVTIHYVFTYDGPR